MGLVIIVHNSHTEDIRKEYERNKRKTSNIVLCIKTDKISESFILEIDKSILLKALTLKEENNYE